MYSTVCNLLDVKSIDDDASVYTTLGWIASFNAKRKLMRVDRIIVSIQIQKQLP